MDVKGEDSLVLIDCSTGEDLEIFVMTGNSIDRVGESLTDVGL